jgi:hypothetical protein
MLFKKADVERRTYLEKNMFFYEQTQKKLIEY